MPFRAISAGEENGPNASPEGGRGRREQPWQSVGAEATRRALQEPLGTAQEARVLGGGVSFEIFVLAGLSGEFTA